MKRIISLLIAVIIPATGTFAQEQKKGIVSGPVRFQGSIGLNPSTKFGAYTLTDMDSIIIADTSGGGFPLTLPAAAGATGRMYYISKPFAANTLTINVSGGGTIDGLASVAITQTSAFQFFSTGVEWKRIGFYSPTGAAGGTVTSIGVSMPSMFNVANTPIIDSGNINITLANQNAGTFLSGPLTGGPAVPTFRLLGDQDIPGTIVRGSRALIGGIGIGSIGDLSLDRTIDFDSTELHNLTWGDGTQASFTRTFNTSGAQDPQLTVSNNLFNFTVGNVQIGGVDVVRTSGAQSLSEKSLVQPIINDFSQAQHPHSGASGGGQLNASNVFGSGTVPVNRLPLMIGDSGSGGIAGLVPAPASGDAVNCLRGDGTWGPCGSGGGGAPTNALYLVTTLNGTLDNERRLVASGGLASNDAGANDDFTLSISDGGVTNAKFRDSGATSVIGRSANSTGVPADISASADGQFLRRVGGVLGFGAIDDGLVPNSISLDNLTQVTTRNYSDLQNIPATFAPSAHASSHQHGGSDQIATATPGANAIPKAGSGGTLADGWLSANVSLLGSAIDLSGAEATGTLAAGRFPALTGDATTSAGSVAVTVARLRGILIPTGTPGDGQILKYNQSTGEYEFSDDQVGAGGSGIATLNTLNASSQSFAVGGGGSDFNINSDTSTHTFNIPSMAGSGVTRGLLTNAAQSIPGAKTMTGKFTLAGAFVKTPRVVTATGDLLDTDQQVRANHSAPITLTLPAIADVDDGHEVTITDVSGNAVVNNITVQRKNSDLIAIGSNTVTSIKIICNRCASGFRRTGSSWQPF